VNEQRPSRERQLAERRARARRKKIRQRRAVALCCAVAVAVIVVVLAWPHHTNGKTKHGGGQSAHASPPPTSAPAPTYVSVALAGDGIKMATFLGSETRRFYGLGPAPKHLDLIWKTVIGSGWTSNKYPDQPAQVWSGTGWTGMPALVRDGGKLYLLIGGYDHKLHKIDAATGKIVWAYAFDDVVKSSPSVFANPSPTGADDRYIVFAGSRRGYPLSIDAPQIAPYRAVTFGSGKELWRLPAPKTASYSRDCDGSGFVLDGREYIGLEDGWFYALDPLATQPWQKWRRPRVAASRLLLGDARAETQHYDQKLHSSNLVLEASPALLGDTIYVASGAGFVYGLRRDDLSIVFSYRTGSDLDGTTVPTATGKLIVPIEKEYIPGHGGLMMLDPTKPAAQSPVWFFPTGDRTYADWLGGIIGSPAINDEYNRDGSRPALAACIGIDGYLYLISQDKLAKGKVPGPDGKKLFSTPQVVFKDWVNGGISTPIIVGDTLIAATYDELVHMYHIDFKRSHKGAAGALPSADGGWWTVSVHETATFSGGGSYESTPVLWDGRVYIGSRNGYYYCLGDR